METCVLITISCQTQTCVSHLSGMSVSSGTSITASGLGTSDVSGTVPAGGGGEELARR